MQHIKKNILDRPDFEDFLATKIKDIYDPIIYNYAVISLYGILSYDNIMGTIDMENYSNESNEQQNSGYLKVYIEVDIQTIMESINLEDKKDYSFLIERNNDNIDNLSRDLKNTVKNTIIIQQNRVDYLLKIKDREDEEFSPAQLLLADSKSDLESWDGSLNSMDSLSEAQRKRKEIRQQEIAHPSSLLRANYPEIEK
jgi:hypothetical protein